MNEIPYWLSFVVVLLAVYTGYRYGARLHRRGFNITGHVHVNDCALIPVALLLFVLLQVCASTMLRNPQIGWYLPVAVEYYLTPMMWLLKLFFVASAMSAVAAVSLLQRHSARYGIVLFTLLVVVAVEALNRWAVQPKLGEIHANVRGGIVLQTNDSTCAAASAANIARHFGIDASEAAMVELLGTTWAGTSPAQLVYGFRKLGLEATKVSHPDRDLSKVRAPAVLLVYASEVDAHAVTYMGQRGPFFEIWDPNSGPRLDPLEKVQAIWGGRAIEVRRGATGG